MKDKVYVFVLIFLSFVFWFIAKNFAINSVGCNSFDYKSSDFMAYCDSTKHGHYDHAAYLFQMEGVGDYVRKANILFLGSSRIQMGLSTSTLTNFEKHHAGFRPYLLGFGYVEQDIFSMEVLRVIRPTPKLVVINADPFFSHTASPHARQLLENPQSEFVNAQFKRLWHEINHLACQTNFYFFEKSVCGKLGTTYRSIYDGRWIVPGKVTGDIPINDTSQVPVDDNNLNLYLQNAHAFLSNLNVSRRCIVITHVPSLRSSEILAKKIAEGLSLAYISPKLAGLFTFDRSHLDTRSAERWSNAFLEELEPIISKCMGGNG